MRVRSARGGGGGEGAEENKACRVLRAWCGWIRAARRPPLPGRLTGAGGIGIILPVHYASKETVKEVYS